MDLPKELSALEVVIPRLQQGSAILSREAVEEVVGGGLGRASQRKRVHGGSSVVVGANGF